MLFGCLTGGGKGRILDIMTSPSELFLQTVQHVAGQALAAAHYQLEAQPMQQARGLLRYGKALGPERYAFIEFQSLYHPQSDLGRFRINLLRNNSPEARAPGPAQVEQTLSQVMWHHYDARVLPAEDHWWLYKHQQDLAYALMEAGKLLFGYGVPWLEA